MRKVSKKRAKDNKTYSKLYWPWREKHPYCVRCGIGGLDGAPPHHMKLPRSKYLNDTSTWLSVCHNCHEWIGENPEEAFAKGWRMRD